MKKVRAARKSQSRSDYSLRPSRVRMALIYAFFFALAVMFGMLIRVVFNNENASPAELFSDWGPNLAIVVVGAVLFAMIDYSRWTIRVQGGEQIEGPSGGMGRRMILPLEEIDWKRTRRSLESRLKIGNAIYTFDGQRILISPWFYPPGNYSELLDLIGYPASEMK